MEISLSARFKSYFSREKDHKLGAIKGVFIPNVLQMIGVILFMRLGWVLGNVGTSAMLMIISLASSILIITSFSLSSIVSNMKVGSGGAYFIISRVLGIEFGSAIGSLLCVSQHASIALCVSGFSLSIQQFFPDISIKLIEAITLTSLITISYISTHLAVKAQAIIFITLFISIGSIFFGSSQVVDASLYAVEFPLPALTFWAGFAMFFPAATGIEAGMSMSGDLRNPSRALPLGAIMSVITAFLLYASLALFLSREMSPGMLRAHPFIVYNMAKIKMLVVVGVWGATLSSALGSILGAPRIIQALAKDQVLPSALAKGHGKTNQPRTAILLVYCTSLILTLCTNINQIIPIMTMICLVSYGLINFVTFFEAFIKNPSWRPNFNTPWPVALFGSLGCFLVMFLINVNASLIVIALTIILCMVSAYRGIGGRWDDIRYSIFSLLVHKGAARLAKLNPNAKSWRPNLISLFESSALPLSLAYFSYALDHGKGFLTFGTTLANEERSKEVEFKQQLGELKIPSFLHVNYSDHSSVNLLQQIKNYGFGPLTPNSVILPLTDDHELIIEVLKDTQRIKKNIILLKSDSANPRLYAESYVTAKRINLWWRGGNQNNFELCLALSYCLRGSPIWSRAEIRIKSLIRDEEELEKLTGLFEKYEKKLRIKKLVFCPILDEAGSFLSNLIEHSEDADFTFLGLRAAREDETDEEFVSYFSNLAAGVSPIPNMAFVLAGEQLSFKKIFS